MITWLVDTVKSKGAFLHAMKLCKDLVQDKISGGLLTTCNPAQHPCNIRKAHESKLSGCDESTLIRLQKSFKSCNICETQVKCNNKEEQQSLWQTLCNPTEMSDLLQHNLNIKALRMCSCRSVAAKETVPCTCFHSQQKFCRENTEWIVHHDKEIK